MESRKITVVSTKTQKKSVIMSGAETLGELKRDLAEAGIDYTDMAFYEGTSKTELKTDESILPKDVPYTNRNTGETKLTNELVFMLTNTNKKIKSGYMSRAEVYAEIKVNHLQDACMQKFGKNFTQCSTAALIELLNDATTDLSEGEDNCSCVDIEARAAIRELTEAIYNEGVVDKRVKDSIFSTLKFKHSTESPYSDSEIDEMFEQMY